MKFYSLTGHEANMLTRLGFKFYKNEESKLEEYIFQS